MCTLHHLDPYLPNLLSREPILSALYTPLHPQCTTHKNISPYFHQQNIFQSFFIDKIIIFEYSQFKGACMSPLALILIVLLILFALGGLPAFNFHTYGYRPTSIATIILVILIILLLLGRI